MSRCEECGAEVSYDDKFCKNCGAKVRAEKPQPSYREAQQETDEEELREKLRLKKELENAIKAFKRGEINIDEFQKKKNIVAEEVKNLSRKKQLRRELRAKTTEEKVFELQREARERAYVPSPYTYEGEAVKGMGEEKTPVLSKRSLYLGLVAIFVIAIIAGGLFLMKSREIWIFQEKAETPKGIEIIGGIKNGGEKLSSSLLQINLNLSDVGEDFAVDERNTGLIKDALEFAGGDSELSAKLVSQGWKENHRIVLKKTSNGSLVMQVDSSISKYALDEAENFTFKGLIEEKRAELENAGYAVSGAAIDDSSILGKKVAKEEATGDTIVYYKILFYKKDVFAEIEVKGVIRKVAEEDAVGYANMVAGRV